MSRRYPEVRSRGGRVLMVLCAALALGCGGGSVSANPAPTPEPDRDPWAIVVDSVRNLVAAGSHSTADSVLARFVARSGNSADASEATFWRAMVALDPENETASPRDALVAIDRYLAGGRSLPRYAEATVLRRTAEVLERAATPIPVAPVAPAPVTDSLARLRAAQDTIRQLRSELETTRTELDRIKRRIRP